MKILLVLALLLPIPAFAGDDLMMLGKGTRKAALFRLYTCELYAGESAASTADILNKDVAAAIKIDVHGNPPGELPEVWQQALDSELSDRIFNKVLKKYDKLTEQDVVWIRYLPGQGTSVSVNDNHLFTDPGRGLMDALLEQWIGEKPVSEDLKITLLGS